ncbi:MAG: tetratricopeptide repeat protein [Pseudomonadales bacterium]|nr:tetratricopeptide repeat protein [Pseudomonadales bacterium]
MNASVINEYVIEINVQNFQSEVLEKSKQVPVVIEFYAEGAEPSQEMAVVLRRLAGEYAGKFLLARVDIQKNQQIVQQLGVRTLPTLKVISEGQLAHELEGPQDEISLRNMLDQLTMSPIERIQEQIKSFLAEGNRLAAIDMLHQAIGEEPTNYALQVELADLLVMESRISEAQEILDGLSDDIQGINKPKNRITFITKAADMPSLDELKSKLAQSPDELMLRYQLAVRLIVDDQIEAALEELLTILKADKDFEDQLARLTMIEVFELLGKGDPTATAYRRKMFAFLH